MNKLSESVHLSQTKTPHLYKIFLEIGLRKLCIGQLDTSAEGTLILKKSKEQILKKINAVGINYQLLSEDKIKYKWIKIIIEGREYVSTREYYLMHGKVFHFAGFELQSFVPIDELNLDTIRRFERTKNNQFNLFERVS
jgi:hypothetical protein